MGIRLGTRKPLQTFYVPRIDTDAEYTPGDDGRLPEPSLDRANTLSSIIETEQPTDASEAKHALVLDLDIPAVLLPSSTPGHSHLIVDVEMTWDQYAAMIQALAVAGVIEPGYAGASIDRGATFIRLPWVRKPEPPEVPPGEAPF